MWRSLSKSVALLCCLVMAATSIAIAGSNGAAEAQSSGPTLCVAPYIAFGTTCRASNPNPSDPVLALQWECPRAPVGDVVIETSSTVGGVTLIERCEYVPRLLFMCRGLPVTVDVGTGIGQATADRDVIRGTSGSDTILALGGDDVICGLGGDDDLRGGSGNDVIYGELGDDIIYGGEGRDTIIAGFGQDTAYGEGGPDFIYGGSDDDILNGGTGNDRISGGPGEDFVYGDGGSDTMLDGGANNDHVYGGGGNDKIFGGAGRDKLFGQGGDDELRGQAGSDLVTNGGPGVDNCLVDAQDLRDAAACE